MEEEMLGKVYCWIQFKFEYLFKMFYHDLNAAHVLNKLKIKIPKLICLWKTTL